MALRTTSAPQLVVIADRGIFSDDTAWLDAIVRVAEAMVGYGSLGVLHVRVKRGESRDRRRLLVAARRSVIPAVRGGLRVVLNGTAEEALEYDFAGVHWPQAAIPRRAPALPQSFSTSASVHGRASSRRAVAAGADYVVFGPVFAPGCKEAPSIGLEPLRALAREIEIPVLAVGGLTPERVPDVVEAGAQGVATVTAVMLPPRPDLVIRAFMEELNQTAQRLGGLTHASYGGTEGKRISR